MALAAGILVAVAVGTYLWLSDGGSPSETANAPAARVEQGVACSRLQEAFMQNQAGNPEALRRLVDAAARAGEQALQQSGQEFGRPEEIAIELKYVLTRDPAKVTEETEALLDEARAACEDLGQWKVQD